MIPSRLRRIVHLLNLHCEEASALVSVARDGSLPRAERVAVALHLGVCAGCRRYRRQLALIREALRRFRPDAEPTGPQGLPRMPDHVRTRIRDALRALDC